MGLRGCRFLKTTEVSQRLKTSLRKEFLKERRILLDFMDEYAEVMNKYTKTEVYNDFKRGYTGLSITYGFALRDMLWLEDGVYCFDEEERV